MNDKETKSKDVWRFMVRDGFNFVFGRFAQIMFRLKCVTAWPPSAALGWTALALLSGPIAWIVCGILLYTTDFAKYLLASYLIWMYLDRETCKNNTRRWIWLRQLPFWKRHRDYFPMRLVKTCDLPPDRNYLFAVFPHGIFSFAGMTTFTTDALDFEGKFPGLDVTVCTLNVVFMLPFMRELALGQGFSSVSEESLDKIFASKEKGKAAAIVVGGAAEAALSKPNEYKILLSKRKGFCRVALKNGCDIVPVFTFGESDLYELYEAKEGSVLHRFQNWFKKVTTVMPVVFYGTGPFCVFPKRVPLTVTVGRPIRVKKSSEPTDSEVRDLHDRFRDGIVKLFDRHKLKYLKGSNCELTVC